MIIPIFLPSNCNDCDSDKHGYDCECSKCKLDKEYASKPRSYYSYRYAVPLRWFYKNLFFKFLRLLGCGIGLGIVFYPLFDIKSFQGTTFYFLWLYIAVGAVVFFISLSKLSDFIKYDFNCAEKVYLEKKYWDKVWDLTKVPKNYKLGEIRETWRYE